MKISKQVETIQKLIKGEYCLPGEVYEYRDGSETINEEYKYYICTERDSLTNLKTGGFRPRDGRACFIHLPSAVMSLEVC